MTRQHKAEDFLTLLSAAAHYRQGEEIFARTMVDGMEDPLDDALRLIGVLMAASAAMVNGRREVSGYVVRSVDTRE
jgi:hypothetical protein